MKLFKKRKVRKYIPRRLDTAPDVTALHISEEPFGPRTVTIKDLEGLVRHLANARDIIDRVKASTESDAARITWHRQKEHIWQVLVVARHQLRVSKEKIQPKLQLIPKSDMLKNKPDDFYADLLALGMKHHRYPHDEVDPDPASGE